MIARGAPQLDVHIEALVLHGVPPGDPRVIQAVERATRQALATEPRATSYAKPGAIANAVGAVVTSRVAR